MKCANCSQEKVEYVGFNGRAGDPSNPWDCTNKQCGKETKIKGETYSNVYIDEAKVAKLAQLNKAIADAQVLMNVPRIYVPNPYGGPGPQNTVAQVVRYKGPASQAPIKSTFTYGGAYAMYLTKAEEARLKDVALRQLYKESYQPGHYILLVGKIGTSVLDDTWAPLPLIPELQVKDYLIGRSTL